MSVLISKLLLYWNCFFEIIQRTTYMAVLADTDGDPCNGIRVLEVHLPPRWTAIFPSKGAALAIVFTVSVAVDGVL